MRRRGISQSTYILHTIDMEFRHMVCVFLCAVGLSLFAQTVFALEANEIFKRADPSIVVILAQASRRDDDKLGSGVLVEPLDVVTSCHVVGGAVRITVKQGSVQRSAKLRFQDAARDLCQIRLDDAFPSGKPIAGVVL